MVEPVGCGLTLPVAQPPQYSINVYRQRGYKMKLSDIIALAKMGYTKADIDELMTKEVPAETTPTDQDKGVEGTADNKDTELENTAETDGDLTSDNIDYETAFNDLKAQLETTQKQLQAIQEKNVQGAFVDSLTNKEADATSLFDAVKNL